MTFDLNNINQFSTSIDQYFFYPFYEKLYQQAKKYHFIALTSPIVGILDATFSIIQAIGGLVESAIKGLTNIFKGMAALENLSIKRGVLQLILGTGVIGVSSIPIIFLRTLRISIKITINPIQTCEEQLINYRKNISYNFA